MVLPDLEHPTLVVVVEAHHPHKCGVALLRWRGDLLDEPLPVAHLDDVIASVRDGVVPLEIVSEQTDDPLVSREAQSHERALPYVAATRAKKDVLVTGFGKPSKLLPWR